MQSKVFFRAGSGNDYELNIEHGPDQYVPQFLSEDEKGWIQDLSMDKGWESLAEMTHDLKVEIVAFESETGN